MRVDVDKAPGSECERRVASRLSQRSFVQGIQSLGGSLLLVPLVILLAGGYWELSRSVVPTSVALIERGDGPTAEGAVRQVRLHFYDDGGDRGRGVSLPEGAHLDLELSRGVERFQVVIQVDFNDVYEVLGSTDGSEFSPLWQVPRGHGGSYLTTRTSPWLESDSPIRYLRVRALRGNAPHVVAGLRLELEPLLIPHWSLIPVLWGLVLVLWSVSRARPGGWARRLLGRWQRLDLWIAALAIAAVLLRLSSSTLIVAGAVLAIWAILRLLAFWWSRFPASLFVVIAVVLLLAWLVPRLFQKVIVARIAELHDLTVDHRLVAGPDVNSDRIRFAAEPADIGEDEFVILFAGDSFTYGLELEYEEAYPYVFEQLVGELKCEQPIRAVNVGWTSASPLLTLRLLREIGYKYEPDLVIYNLDMTDFHDDLSYEDQLRQGGDLEIDSREALVLLVARSFPEFFQYLPDLQTVREILRGSGARGAPSTGDLVPEDRFFVTSQPLESSVDAIERGVVRNLEELNSFVGGTLGSSLALVVYPRAYQYSMRESPRNWEAQLYEVLGPYVREPFNYFARESAGLPYPVFSLLAAFEETDEFPLFLEDDPHWNAEGARFVAAAVADWIVETGLIPCSPSRR